jgi:putative hydrolase of the HAD superfamily
LSQTNKIKALAIEQYFERIVLTATLGSEYAKPHVKPFLTVEKHFGEAVGRYMYVADNPKKDFVGPRSLGWKTVRIRRQMGLYSSLQADLCADADLEMPDLSFLVSAIKDGHKNLC